MDGSNGKRNWCDNMTKSPEMTKSVHYRTYSETETGDR